MNNHTLNAATKTVRILPMSPHESEGMSIGDVQRKYFRNQLCVNQGEYRCRQVLLSDPGTTVLFQYRSRIIASAVLIKWSRLDRPDRDGYTSVMHFDPATIRVFAPAGPELLRKMWPHEFKRFSQARQNLSPSALPRFFAAIDAASTSAVARLEKEYPGFTDASVGGRIPTTKSHVRQGSASVEVARIHAKMQRKLRDELITRYGRSKVVAELNGVDLCVRNASETILFEIKADSSPLMVIRQALGQILEYGFFLSDRWNGTQLRLVIVGRKPLRKTEKAYLSLLNTRFQLPVSYQTVKI